jgi:ketosteroid isomerase-like protein
MSLSEHKQATSKFLEAMVAGDIETLKSLLHDDAVFWVPPSSANRVERPLLGREKVAQLVGGEALGNFAPGGTRREIVHMTAEDDRVAVLWDRIGVTAKGRAYNVPYNTLLRFQEGRVAEIWVVPDTYLARHLLDVPHLPPIDD